MKIAIFLLACILTQILDGSNGGPTPVQIAGRTHGRIAFKPGLPDFKPVARWLVEEPYFAAIPVPDSLGVVHVCFGRDSEGRQRVFLVSIRPDKTAGMDRVTVDPDAGDTLICTTEPRLLSSNESHFPLELRIVSSSHELIYRWTLAKEDPKVPGGLPEARPSLISIGKPFPDFEVDLLKGGKRNLAASRGRICVLNWWWTRCGPCIAEMPGLNTLVKKYAGGVDFISVNPDPVHEVRAFLAKRTFSYQHALTDTSGYAMFGRSAPRNIIIDKAGNVVFDESGGSKDAYKMIEAVIQRELRH